MKNRKAAALAAIMITAAALTGCAEQYTPSGTGINVVTVDLPGGDTVVCVSASGGGVDCNWDEAR